jgi:hypothetical protein
MILIFFFKKIFNYIKENIKNDKEELLNYLFEYFPGEDAVVPIYNLLKKKK